MGDSGAETREQGTRGTGRVCRHVGTAAGERLRGGHREVAARQLGVIAQVGIHA